MRTLCDACESAAAIVFCAADEAALCRSCDDKVHLCNKLASRHVRVGLAAPSDVPRCDICENAPGSVIHEPFCLGLVIRKLEKQETTLRCCLGSVITSCAVVVGSIIKKPENWKMLHLKASLTVFFPWHVFCVLNFLLKEVDIMVAEPWPICFVQVQLRCSKW